MVFLLLWHGTYSGKCENIHKYILLGDSFKITHTPDESKKGRFLPFLQWDAPLHLQAGVEATYDLSVHSLTGNLTPIKSKALKGGRVLSRRGMESCRVSDVSGLES